MTLKLHLSGKKEATIINAFSPTITNSDKIKTKSFLLQKHSRGFWNNFTFFQGAWRREKV